MVELFFEEGRASEAHTWVCQTGAVRLPYFQEALEQVLRKGVSVGLHLGSRSIVLNFPDAQPAQTVRRKLRTILGQAGAARSCVDKVESFDLFHAESWGLLKVNAPTIPESCDVLVEEDDLSEEEFLQDDVDGAPASECDLGAFPEGSQDGVEVLPDIFALVAVEDPAIVRVQSMNRALTRSLCCETPDERSLKTSMEQAGGPLTPYLEKLLASSRGTRSDVHRIQEADRALARVKSPDDLASVCWWLGPPPATVMVCIKPHMGLERRVEWIVWKAQVLRLELTLPIFMAIFKQVTSYRRSGDRLAQYKLAVEQWRGSSLRWMELPSDERKLIRNISEGFLDCYCKHCRQVLNPGAKSPFCSGHCAAQFCVCGAKFEVRQVIDHVTWERQQNQVGPYHGLVELARMLAVKDDVTLYAGTGSLAAKHDELTRRRGETQCCKAIEGFLDKNWCKACLDEWMRLNYLQRCVGLIRRGDVTWGHCQEAANALQKLADLPVPKMAEKTCPTCEATRKRTRLL